MSTISLCFIDAARQLRPSREQWAAALKAVPEKSERQKLTQYYPPSGVALYEHFNPISSLFARHLLRAVHVKDRQQQQQQQAEEAGGGAAATAQQQQQQQEEQPQHRTSPSIGVCHRCASPILPILRTMEGRPCLVASSSSDAASNFCNIESCPNVNISHNNGVVLAGILPDMSKACPTELKRFSSLNSSSSCSRPIGAVLGVDVMCVDLVPTAMQPGGLDGGHFTAELVDEFLQLMECYMTPAEWGWINQNARRDDESEENCLRRQREFATNFYRQFQERLSIVCPWVSAAARATVSAAAAAAGVEQNENGGAAHQSFLSDPRNFASLYRLWRFLLLWTIKEAVLKAAGIGLGFDTTSIEVSFSCASSSSTSSSSSSSSWCDVDDPNFYAVVLPQPVPTATASAAAAPAPRQETVSIHVRVPDGVLPGGVFRHFDTWLLWDRASMSIGAVVCAPACVSRWSGHCRYVFKSSNVHRGDEGDGLDDAALVASWPDCAWLSEQDAAAAGAASSSSSSTRVQANDNTVSVLKMNEKVEFLNCQSSSSSSSSAGCFCCGCCLAETLL